MKPSPFFYLLLLTPILLMLAGCPLPNRYLFNGNKKTTTLYTQATSPQASISSNVLYPWLDTHKKVIIYHGQGVNNTTDTLCFILSKSIIYSPTDTFEAIDYQGKLVNNYRNEHDTIQILPGESKEIDAYFISRHNYTHREFRRTNKHDTMQLHLNVFGEKDTVINMINYHAKSTIFHSTQR